MTDLQKLAFDASNSIARDGYTKEQLNDAVRNAVKDACGGEWNYYKFMENRYKVFAIMAEIMPVSMHANLAGKFDGFAEFKDTAVGDKPYFIVEDQTTYPVVTIARGNQDIDRNKIIDRNFTIATITKGIKFYEELDMFMAGKMDMGRLTEKASIGMANYTGELISDTIYNSYSAVGTNYKVTGAFDASTLANLIEHIKAANSVDTVQIFGTTTGLVNVADGFGYSDRAKDSANSVGYYGTFRGTDLFALPQAYGAGTTAFKVNTTSIIILPASEKIVKVLFEGEALINMTDGMGRNDMQPEIFFSRRIGAGAITVPEGKYGLYRFQ
jgi:hypothetical protein